MSFPQLAPLGASHCALALSLLLSCAAPEVNSTLSLRQDTEIRMAKDELAYVRGEGVALDWIGKDTIAMVSNGALQIVDFSAVAPPLEPLPKLELSPVLDYHEGRLLVMTKSGDAVVLDTQTWAELERSNRTEDSSGVAQVTSLALAAEGAGFATLVGGVIHLHPSFEIQQLPNPGRLNVDGMQDINFGPAGNLHVNPGDWTIDKESNRWTREAGLGAGGLPFGAAAGRNRTSWNPVSNLYGAFHSEPLLQAEATREGVTDTIDLGYRTPGSLVVARDGSHLVASTSSGFDKSRVKQHTNLPGMNVIQKQQFGSLTRVSLHSLSDMVESEPSRLSVENDSCIGMVAWNAVVPGVKAASLGNGGLATIDTDNDLFTDAISYLRFLSPELEVLAQLPIQPGKWPVELAAGGDLLAVCYPENRICIYQLEDGFLPAVGLETEAGELDRAETALGPVSPIVTISISSLEGAPAGTQTELPKPRTVFALRGDGNLLAMMGPNGNISFANPRTGWPNEIVSVRLPKDCGVPLAARFRGADSVDGEDGELVVTSRRENGQIAEWTLNSGLALWSEPTPVIGKSASSPDGAVKARFVLGPAGHVECRESNGDLVWRKHLGFASADALATGPDGSIAIAAEGKLLYLRIEDQALESASAEAADR